MNDLAFASATDLLAALDAGRTSSAELMEMYIERHQRHNPGINAIVATDFESARLRARHLDAARAQGLRSGPLHGLPMTIKDSIEVAGMPCISGYPGFAQNKPDTNADVVAALLAAGAIIFGKTNVSKLTQDMQSYNDVYGQTNNPWNPARVPGGSSGGSAAAIAAGLTGAEIGSDIGGSIRIPAHCCGIYGHKPSFGIVSLKGHVPPRPGMFPADYSYDGDLGAIGPLARNAEDLDLLLGVIAGPKKPERIAYKLDLPPSRKTCLRDFRVGLWLDDPQSPVDIQVGDALAEFVAKLAASGCIIKNRRPDIEFAASHDIFVQLLTANASIELPDELYARAKAKLPALDPHDRRFQAQWVRGTALTHHDWRDLNYRRLLMCQNWADYFSDIDILLCPAMPVTAFPHDHSDLSARTLLVNGQSRDYLDTLLTWTGLVTVSYLPATAIPIGLAGNGMPVGIQAVGPYLEDRTTVEFARLTAELTGGCPLPTGYT